MVRLAELKVTKMLAVVYGGRFQPFHQGHYGVWLDLVKTFGKGQVWLSTSNKTNFNSSEGSVSPLNFNEKQELITELYAIPADKIIECANPTFSPKEVLELYKGPTVLVLIVGDKDEERYTDNQYFKPWPKVNDKPIKWSAFAENAALVNGTGESTTYYLVNNSRRLPGITGTKIRSKLLQLADDQGALQKEFKRVFGKWDPEIARMLLARLKQIHGKQS